MSQNDKGEVFIPCNFAAGGTYSEKCIRISTSAAIAKPVSEIGEFIEEVR